MPKVRLAGPAVALNARIQAETMRDLKLFAVDRDMTVSAAVNWCLRDAIGWYKQVEADNEQLEKDNQ